MACESHGEHSIQLDCPPGSPRPGDLIDFVLERTGLKSYKVTPLFGEASWVFPKTTCEEWDKIQKITQPKVESLYHSGTIRYGSW
jgi:hypothetical protein